MHQVCDENTVLITGAPLKNLGAAIQNSNDQQFRIGAWFCQGGFAGEGVVPTELQMPKFKGKITCPTFNLNGDVKSAQLALHYPGIGSIHFVSKNVCHRVAYETNLHSLIGQVLSKGNIKESLKMKGLSLIYQGLELDWIFFSETELE